MFPVDLIMLMGLPMVIVTFLLAIHAQWRWQQTMDAILRGMKVKEVRGRVEKAEGHRRMARYHASAMAFAIIFWIVLSVLMIPYPYNGAYALISIILTFWFYFLFTPHMLALLLYHIRWNPNTLQRKQKLDAEDEVYEGNYDLDPDAHYSVNEEGELIQVAMMDEAQQMQQSS